MKRFFLLATFVCAALFTSCEGYDDSELVNRVNNIENRLKQLEETCKQLNTNISSLQTIVTAIQKNDQISSMAPISKDGKELGYVITFTSGKTITIYHGADGENGQDGQNGADGHTPVIGVKQDTDGNYYWTIDGEWLTDADGNKIRANATDGKDGEDGSNGAAGANGKDGITPQLKIENEYWYISYDNGKTWTKLGKATGEQGSQGQQGAQGPQGDSFFQDVTEDDENVYFILADGTTITIPKAQQTQNIVLTYIPRYSDGKATVYYSSKENSYVEFDFEVSPAGAATNWSEYATVKAVYTLTRASVNLVDMEILEWSTDDDNGIITVKASGANLSDEFFAGEQEASARLAIESDNLNIISDYIPMVAEEVITTTEYSLTVTYKTDSNNQQVYLFAGSRGIAGTENKLVSIDYGDETFGTDIKHTYANSGEYTVKFYFEKPITEIADYAFGSGWEMYSVTIPNTVKTIGDYAFSSYSLQDLPLKEVIFEEGSLLESIGDGAFAFTSIETFCIPQNVTSVGKFAFTSCTKLTEIRFTNYSTFIRYSSGVVAQRMPDGSEAWVAYPGGKNNVPDILIGNTVDEIRSGVFSFCSNIKSFDFTYAYKLKVLGQIGMNCANLESIIGLERIAVNKLSGNSFNSCPKLKSITIPANITYLESCFSNNDQLRDVTLEEGVISIIEAFNNCQIETIAIPATVSTLNNSFNGNKDLTLIYCYATTPPAMSGSFDAIPNSAKIYVPAGSGEAYKAADGWSDYADMIVEMGTPNDEIWYTSSDGEIVTPYATDVFGANIVSNTYENGKGVIKFDGAVTSIGNSAFWMCRSLISISIPNSVTSIGDSAFLGCYSLTQITIPNSVISIGDGAFNTCSSLTEITIPNGVTSIGDSAFFGCSSLTSITIPNSVTSIGLGAFFECNILTSITIPNSVTSIGDSAFFGCSSLTSITIPNSVTSIGRSTFKECSSLRNIICERETPPMGGQYMFNSIHSSAKIYVPAGSGEAYKTAQYWSDYADIIVEEEM